MQQVNHVIDFIAGCMAIQGNRIVASLAVVLCNRHPMAGIAVSFIAAQGLKMGGVTSSLSR